MATISVPNLIITPIAGSPEKVTIQVTYDVTFSPAERNLTASPFEWKFLETIQVTGVEIPFGTTGEILLDKFLPVQAIEVTPGGTPQTFSRMRTAKALRTLLQEDPAPGDADEIRCNIQILPVSANGFTNVVSLPG
jgi:hypothetical protein